MEQCGAYGHHNVQDDLSSYTTEPRSKSIKELLRACHLNFKLGEAEAFPEEPHKAQRGRTGHKDVFEGGMHMTFLCNKYLGGLFGVPTSASSKRMQGNRSAAEDQKLACLDQLCRLKKRKSVFITSAVHDTVDLDSLSTLKYRLSAARQL